MWSQMVVISSAIKGRIVRNMWFYNGLSSYYGICFYSFIFSWSSQKKLKNWGDNETKHKSSLSSLLISCRSFRSWQRRYSPRRDLFPFLWASLGYSTRSDPQNSLVCPALLSASVDVIYTLHSVKVRKIVEDFQMINLLERPTEPPIFLSKCPKLLWLWTMNHPDMVSWPQKARRSWGPKPSYHLLSSFRMTSVTNPVENLPIWIVQNHSRSRNGPKPFCSDMDISYHFPHISLMVPSMARAWASKSKMACNGRIPRAPYCRRPHRSGWDAGSICHVSCSWHWRCAEMAERLCDWLISASKTTRATMLLLGQRHDA